MLYQNIRRAVFLDRPNRFIANISLAGVRTACHVKNTGRYRELLIPGVPVLVQAAASPQRKTAYDLIAVWKNERLVNIDAAAPNQVFAEWVRGGGLFNGLTLLRPECRHGASRFDFYVEAAGRRAFVEVKGVTLEQDGIARFPDAPTLRGVKHLMGLIECARTGYDAYAVFIIQMCGVRYLEPNWATHPEFGLALQDARAAGVHIIAMDCTVAEDSLTVRAPVDVRLGNGGRRGRQ
ncbi:MAG: DNA/RNA nuclease SfsA [bacterium]